LISLIIPVFKNAENICPLIKAIEELAEHFRGELEVVFVVDGSPDESFALLAAKLPSVCFASKLLLLSRNFGSFSAIRAGLAAARGPFFAVMAADLQEPPGLIKKFYELLSSDKYDVIIGTRESREDPYFSRLTSSIYWRLYRKFVQSEMPEGGVDVFGCNDQFRQHLMQLGESNTSLVGLIIWLGYRKALVPYRRRKRQIGRSAWSFSKKMRYLVDSIFAFSDLPIRLLMFLGMFGIAISVLFSLLVFIARIYGIVTVPGYSVTVILIMFFGGLNSCGIGLVGGYLWRTFENTKGRPNYIVALEQSFGRRQTRS